MSKIKDLVALGIRYQPVATAPVPSAQVDADQGDFSRGFEKSMLQIPQTAGGAVAYAGDVIGSDSMRDYGLKVYENNSNKIAAITKDSDSLTNVLQGDESGADWAQNAAGYVTGQALTAVATGGIGGFIGKKVAGMAASKLAQGMAAQRAASLGMKAGAGTALMGQNLMQTAGSIYPEALAQAQLEGRDLDGGDLARVGGAAVGSAAVDTAMDALMIGKALKGARLAGQGVMRTAAKQVPLAMAREGVTEGIQTGIERFGAGKELGGEGSTAEYVDSIGVGMVGGSMGGAAASVRARKVPETGPLSRAANAGIESEAQQFEASSPPPVAGESTAPVAAEAEFAAPQPVQGDLLGAVQSEPLAPAEVPELAPVAAEPAPAMDAAPAENVPARALAEGQGRSPDAPPATVADMTDEQLAERMDYVTAQAQGSGWNKMMIAARDEIAAEQARRAPVDAAPQPILNPKGEPFKAKVAATRALKGREDTHAIEQVEGGFILAPIQPPAQGVADEAVPETVDFGAGSGADAVRPGPVDQPGPETDGSLLVGARTDDGAPVGENHADPVHADATADTKPALKGRNALDELMGMEEDAGEGFKKNDRAIAIIKKAAEGMSPEAKAKVTRTINKFTKVEKDGTRLIKPEFYNAIGENFGYVEYMLGQAIDSEQSAPAPLSKLEQGRARHAKQEDAVRKAAENLAARQAAKQPDAPAPTGNPMIDNPASWVIKNRDTGEVVMETFDKKKVDALNTAKYEAVPIHAHLASLNEKPTAPAAEVPPAGEGANATQYPTPIRASGDTDDQYSARVAVNEYMNQQISRDDLLKRLSGLSLHEAQLGAALMRTEDPDLLKAAEKVIRSPDAPARESEPQATTKQEAESVAAPALQARAGQESADFKERVLSAAFEKYGSRKLVESVPSNGMLAAKMKKTGRPIFVHNGRFGRDEFKRAHQEAKEAGLDPSKITVYADSITYTGANIDAIRLDSLTGFDGSTPAPQAPAEESGPQAITKPLSEIAQQGHRAAMEGWGMFPPNNIRKRAEKEEWESGWMAGKQERDALLDGKETVSVGERRAKPIIRNGKVVWGDKSGKDYDTPEAARIGMEQDEAKLAALGDIAPRRPVRTDKIGDQHRAQREDDEKAAQEAEAARKNDDHNGFLTGRPEVMKGRLRTALSKQYRFDGEVMTVRERVESLHKAGKLEVSTIEEDKIKPMSRMAFHRADQRTQDAHARKVKEGGKVTTYLVNDSELGKVGYDYAQHLLTGKSESAKEVPAPVAEQAKVEAAPAPRAPASVQPEQESTKPSAPIADFGEKIHGAKKDTWTRSMSEELPGDAKDITLSKHFPEPDYDKQIEAGVDVKVLAAIKAMRDEIPAKPKMPYKLRTWAENVKTLRGMANDLLAGDLSIDAVLRQMRAAGRLGEFADRIEMYAALGYPTFTKAGDYRISRASYTMFEGKPYPNGIAKYGIEIKGSFPRDFFNTLNEATDALRAKLDAAADKPAGAKEVKLDLYRLTGSSDVIIGKKISAGKFIDLKTGFKTVSEARKYLAEHKDELAALLEQKKDVRPERRTVNSPRVGEDYRKGEDVTPEQFGQAFGFRGVQFGNYVEQKRRATDLNNAYDALTDMAGIINVPPKALSLHGTLGLAFGARGSGGKNPAAAHYEPGQIVINLTKNNGAGSLAHEWFHGLDNYFERMRGAEGEGHVTDNPRVRMKPDENRKMVADESVRPEVLEAFKGVVDAIRQSGMAARSKSLDGRRTKDYWSTIHEMAARAFESYVIDKAAEQGHSNDYLANIVSEDAHKALDAMMGVDEPYPYPLRSEAPTINAAFDKLFSTIQTRDTDKGVELYDITKDRRTLTIEVDGVRRPIHNSKGQKVAADFKGQMNFWKWFGDSKVVDEKGAPLVVYHGTNKDFDSFDTPVRGGRQRYYFAADPLVSSEYGAQREGANVMPTYVSLKNPLVFNNEGRPYSHIDLDQLPSEVVKHIPDREILRGGAGASPVVSLASVARAAEIAGHDGVIAHETRDGGGAYGDVTPTSIYIALDRKQIKSATGNAGTFNPDSANITHDLMADSGLDAGQSKALAALVKEGSPEGSLRAKVAAIMEKQAPAGTEKVKSQIAAAKRNQQLAPEVADFALWALDRNPHLARDLDIAIKDSDGGQSGSYKSIERLMTLFGQDANPGTAVHEILHHSERMMPQQVQEGIAAEWFRSYQAAWDKADAKTRSALEDMLTMDRSKQAFDRVLKAFESGTLDYNEHYPLSNASEYWAVNATRIMARRYHSSSWIARAKTWLAEMVEKVKGLLGLESDAAILAALDGIIKGDGKFVSPNMLTQIEVNMDAPDLANAPRRELQAEAKKYGLPGSASSDELRALLRIVKTEPSEWTRADFDLIAPHLGLHQDMRAGSADRVDSMLINGLLHGQMDHLDSMDKGGFTYAGKLRGGDAYLILPVDQKFKSGRSATLAEGTPLFIHFTSTLKQDVFEAVKGGRLNPHHPLNRKNEPNPSILRDIPANSTAFNENIKASVVTDVSKAVGHKLADLRSIALQTLGRRQLVDIYADDFKPEGKPSILAKYSELMQKMDAEKNDAGAKADQIADAWGKLADEKQLAELMHDATLARIDPAKEYEPGDNRAKYGELAARFKKLSPQAQSIYRQARDTYSAHYNKVQKEIRARIERAVPDSPRRAALLEKMEKEFFEKVKGVYFPLARFGEYMVIVKQGGETVSVSFAETMNEADKLRAELSKQFPSKDGFKVGKVIKKKEFNARQDAVSRGFMQELFGVLDQYESGGELQDDINQLYLSSLPDLSWAKHGIHRKGTPGFSQDARRAFAQNVFHGARYLAKLKYADQLGDRLNDMQAHVDARDEDESYDSVAAQQVVDEMVKRHESYLNPKSHPLSTALTSFGFIWYLGLSPASAIVNLSQTALVAYPMLGAKYGFAKAGAALLAASKLTAVNRNDLSNVLKGEELDAFNRAVSDGVIDISMAHDLAGIASGDDAKVHAKIRPVMKWASFMFHHGEKFNRQSTFLSAYRMAKEGGATNEQAYEAAVNDTYASQFDYSAANRPRIMQGNMARVILLFKQYAQNMVYSLTRNAQLAVKGDKQAAKTLAGLIASHAMAAGVLGLPVVGPLLALASMLGSDEDEPWDAKIALRNMLADVLGQKPAEVLTHGVSRLTPWDISGRVGLDKLILPDVQEGLEGAAWAEKWLTAAIGPIGGVLVNGAKGMGKIADGDYQRGLEDLLPVALRNPVKSIRLAQEGVQDKTGVSILDDTSIAEEIGQLAGFSPSRSREATEGKSAVLSMDKKLGARRSKLVAMWAQAKMMGDVEAVQEVNAEIKEWNAKQPDRKITPRNLMTSVRNRVRRIEEAEDGIYLPRKRQSLREVGRFARQEEESEEE